MQQAPAARLTAALAVLVATGTFVAAQIDFARRHHPGISATRYWIPQLLQIWVPGLATVALLALASWWLARGR